MKYKLYINSEQAWRGMLEAVQSARRSIYIEMYIFLDDTRGYEFVEALKERAEQGISVKLIFDSFGSARLPRRTIAGLRNAGVEVLFFSRWFRRTHRKILIVDERTAFLGGVNISEAFREWSDLQMKVSGTVARMLLRSFAKTYALCGGTDPHIKARTKKRIFRRTKTWIVDHWPMHKKHRLKELYKKTILEAKHEIQIVTPYFAPSRWIKACLHQAVLRGVSVKILIPRRVEYRVVTRVNYHYAHEFSALGIKMYLSRKMNHAKAMLVDGEKGIVGSQNLDFLSFGFMNEVGVFSDNKRIVGSLRRIFASWMREADVFNGRDVRIRWYDRIIAVLLKVAEPIMLR